jgi:hypothetical protein
MRNNLAMSVKHTVAAILFGSVLASLPALAQDEGPYKAETGYEATVPSANIPNVAEASALDSIQRLIGSDGSLRAANFPPNVADESEAAADEEREFIQRLNRLARALNDFNAAYKSGVVDLKKANALRKALQELQKSEWFKPQKAK